MKHLRIFSVGLLFVILSGLVCLALIARTESSSFFHEVLLPATLTQFIVIGLIVGVVAVVLNAALRWTAICASVAGMISIPVGRVLLAGAFSLIQHVASQAPDIVDAVEHNVFVLDAMLIAVSGSLIGAGLLFLARLWSRTSIRVAQLETVQRE